MTKPDDPSAVARARAELAETATSVLRGDLGVIAGVRALVRLHGPAALPVDDPDVLRLVAADAETDHLPVSPAERARWPAEALAATEAEIEAAEAEWRGPVREACRRLVERLAPGT